MHAPYDYLIVGSGLFGAVFAHEMKKRGKKVLVLEKRGHIGGNIYTETKDGIPIHRYGAHIFHTSDKEVWDYVSRLAEFNRYTNAPMARCRDELYNLPFNMNTFHQLWGVKTPQEAKERIERQKQEAGIREITNLEEQAISLVGTDIYEKLVKGYTQKQWGRECRDLPAFIIRRLPVRFTFDNNYFNDRYQGIPIGGYTQIIEKLLEGVEVRTGQNYLDDPAFWRSQAKKLVYTGPLDELYGCEFGHLAWRSLRFEEERLETENWQGCAVINYTDAETPWTRIIEHTHFEGIDSPVTWISREYPESWKPGREPYYPVNDEENNAKYQKYAEKAARDPDLIPGGRLGLYQYLDMDQVIRLALDAVKKEEMEETL